MKVDIMLAKDFHKGMGAPKSEPDCLPPEGWMCSEKWDGYRAMWLGEEKVFVSRGGKVFAAPEYFKSAMPPNIKKIDGELWIGREEFEAMGVVRKKNPDPLEWIRVKFIAYDAPDESGTFEERYKKLEKVIRNNKTRWNIVRKKYGTPFSKLECPLRITEQTKIKSQEHLDEMYKKVLSLGGEGVMIKNPKSFYKDGRSNHMLKVKPSFDEEALIVDYTKGKGKYTKKLGGFVCVPLKNNDTYHTIDKNKNHEFTISGMDDEVRENYKDTHPVGTIISFEHSGKTSSGKPRFARYIRKRDDIIIKDDEENISHSTEKRDKIISIMLSLGNHEKVNGQVFKSNSYFKLVNALKKMNDDSELTQENILSIKGVGTSLYEKVDTILKTGTCPQYEKIKDIKDPRNIFLQIHGVGPKKAKEIVDAGFTTIDELKSSKEKKQILNDVQLMGLKHYEDLLQRIPYEEIQQHEKMLKDILFKIDKNADLTIAGSYRRNKKDSGDIDILLKSNDKKIYDKFISKLKTNAYLIEDLAYGNKKYNGVCKLVRDGVGRRIDIMYTKPEEYPFAILYFTGSDDFNKMMRKLILEKGLTINEYSLKYSDTKKKVDHIFNTEKDIFDYLEMGYVEPWQRL